MKSKGDKKNKKILPVLSGIVALIVVVAVVLGVLNSDIGLDKHEVKAGITADANPLKGFFPYVSEVDFPSSMEWFYLPVNAVHIGEGEFDWTALEHRLNMVAGRGHQAVLRFYYDCPGDVSGIPQFLLDSGLKVRAYDEPVDLGGGGLCPDYTDEKMIAAMKEFISEFGEQYDGDPRIGFITEGILGFWGEWHNWPFDEDIADNKPNWQIPASAYEMVYDEFDKAFDITPLLVREPKNGVENEKYKTGFHDDSYAYATLSAERGGQEWSYMSKVKGLKMEGAWEYAPIGGEVYPPIQPDYFKEEYFQVTPDPDNDPYAELVSRQDWYECLDETHASFMLCDAIRNYQGTTRENAIEAAKVLGYDMQVTSAAYKDVLNADSALKVNIQMKNTGVAPFYYGHELWPMVIGIKQNGELVKQYYTEWDLCDVKADGKEYEFKFSEKEHGLGGGDYTVCLKVQNPIEGGLIFSFANEGMGEDGWLELGTMTVEGAAVSYAPVVYENVMPIVPVAAEVMADGEGGQYQAENGIYEGVAVSEEVENAVGGLVAGWIGSGMEGTGSVTIRDVMAEEAGFYNVKVDYVLGEKYRMGSFDVNGSTEEGGDSSTYRFSSSGGWEILGTKDIVLFLEEGPNTIKFYNTNGWAPSVDSITISKGSLTGIQNIDGNLSDWPVADEPAYEDDFHKINVTSDGGYIYYAVEVKGDLAACPDWSLKIDSQGNGTDYVVTAEGLYAADGGMKADKLADAGTPALHVAQNGNTIEIMLRKVEMEDARTFLGNNLEYYFEFANGNEVMYSTNNGKDCIYELVSGALILDKNRRFAGNKLHDWSTVDCAFIDAFQSMWVDDDEQYLYFASEYADETGELTEWSLEINKDADCGTGYAKDWIWYWLGSGTDVVVNRDGLFEYDEENNLKQISDGSDGAVEFSIGDGRLEVKVDKSVIDAKSSTTINYSIIYNKVDGEWYDGQIAGRGADMPSYNQKVVAEARFEGVNPMYDGWADVKVSELAGRHKIWLANDAEYLYIATQYKYDDIEKWEILLNTDYMKKTGMQAIWPFSPGGADFLISGDMKDDAKIPTMGYQEVSDGNWTFGREVKDAVTAVVDKENKTLEVRILRSALSTEERKAAAAVDYGVRYILENGDAVASSNGGEFAGYMYTK